MLTIVLLLLVVAVLSRPRARALLADGLARGGLQLQARYGSRALAGAGAAVAPGRAARPARTVTEPVRRRMEPLDEFEPFEPVLPARHCEPGLPARHSSHPTELATMIAPAAAVAAPAPAFALTVIGRLGGESHPLAPDNILGRGAAASIRLDDTDVSRRHAQLTVTGDRVRLADLGSVNGTYVNGARCEQAMLEPGDVIRIGKRFEARLVGGPPRAA